MKPDSAIKVIKTLQDLNVIAVHQSPFGAVIVSKSSADAVVDGDYTELLNCVKVNVGNGFHFTKAPDHSHLAIESVY